MAATLKSGLLPSSPTQESGLMQLRNDAGSVSLLQPAQQTSGLMQQQQASSGGGGYATSPLARSMLGNSGGAYSSGANGIPMATIMEVAKQIKGDNAQQPQTAGVEQSSGAWDWLKSLFGGAGGSTSTTGSYGLG